VPYQKVGPGDRLITYGPSGGGYGDPFRRDPAAVLDNVLDGLFSPEAAREHYGVAIVDGAVDVAATEKLRKSAN
jgi:N-methylhydantoinase B